MNLYSEILTRVLEDVIADIACSTEARTEHTALLRCCAALEKIKAAVDNDSLDDKECFVKIEEIVRTFEALGSPCSRHDFG